MDPKIDFKVCIIDDEPFIRDIYKTCFSREGFKAVTAKDGEEGLAVLKSERPDVALIDISMPKKNGIELMEAVRSDKEISRLPIVVMTNFDDPETIKKVEKFDTKFYLVKSLFDPSKVVGIVREVLVGG